MFACRKLDTESPDFSVALYNLIERWIITDNWNRVGCPSRPNEYCRYIKYFMNQLFPNEAKYRLLQYYMHCAIESEKWFELLHQPRWMYYSKNEFSAFEDVYRQCCATPLPKNIYIGKMWSLEELCFRPTSFAYDPIHREVTFVMKQLRIKSSPMGTFTIQTTRSLFPGYIHGLNAFINVEDMLNDRPISPFMLRLTLNEYVTTDQIEIVSSFFHMACPADNLMSVSVWLEESISASIDHWSRKGFCFLNHSNEG